MFYAQEDSGASSLKTYCFALGHTKLAFNLFYSAFCLFSRSLAPHIVRFAYLRQNTESDGMTQKRKNEAIWTLLEYEKLSNITN